LHGSGLKDAWFAILEGDIIATGLTKEKTIQNLQDIVPSEKRDFVYVFHLK